LPFDTKNITIQLNSGNKKTFEKLFHLYYAPLCRYASSFRLSSEDCEEHVQQLFFDIWQQHQSLTIKTSIKSYLYTALRNQILNKIKHEKVKQEYAVNQIHHADTTVSYIEAEQTELENHILQIIEKLPPERKRIFILSRNEGLKYREIAEQLNISIKTVENQMGKALAFMREALQEYLSILILLLTISAFIFSFIE
jgi:RNA polymerase sigma-70 factor (ECF subfamily)